MQEDGESVKIDWMQPPGNGHKITQDLRNWHNPKA